MDVDMDVDMENAQRRDLDASYLADRQRRAQNFGNMAPAPSSQPSSSSTTSFPSPMNDAAQPAHPFDHQMTAPLPSPSARDQDSAYPRSQSAFPDSSTHHHTYFQPQQAQTMTAQPNFSNQQTSTFGHLPQHGVPQNNPTATTSFLKDFNLVAEAAKRAQMAVIMRDLESVSL